MLSEQRLAEIAAVEAAATPGPWISHHGEFVAHAETYMAICRVNLPTLKAWWYGKTIDGPNAQLQANKDFIATARQAVPELLAEVQRLHAACATAQSVAWLMARHAPTCRAPLQSSTPGMARVCTCETGRVLRNAFAGDGADAELGADCAGLVRLLTLNWHGYYCAECGTSVPAACAECTAAGCYLHDLRTNRRGLPPVAGASVTPWHPPAAE